MQVLAFLLARFSEPSSYAGLGALLALVGLHFSDSDLGQIAQFLAAGCGLAALLLKERGILRTIALMAMLGGALGACAPLVGAGVAGDSRCRDHSREYGVDDSGHDDPDRLRRL